MAVVTTPPAPCQRLHDSLEAVYRKYHDPGYLHSDPLCIVWRYDDPADRQIIALVAASLAYGNVKAILCGIESVADRLGESPARRLADQTPAAIAATFRGWRYRVTSGDDMAGLLVALKSQVSDFRSLHAAFASHRAAGENMLDAMARWTDDLRRRAGRPLAHLLASPARGSACKRLCLYLRWMVRCDCIDPGGFSSIDPAELIAPVDVHIHRAAMQLGWTQRKQANLNTALDVTAALRAINADDPLKYDFAMTRPGILNEALFV